MKTETEKNGKTQVSYSIKQSDGASVKLPKVGDIELDALVGRLLDALKDMGIDEHTLVLFNSDNGPETVHTDWMRKDHDHDAAGGFRGMKRDGWEGGHRVPSIAWWLGKIQQARVSTELNAIFDLMPTFIMRVILLP